MYTNKLIAEKSPYLLQHAHNPVDWRPWGEEAFAEARGEDKPIFLSVGYSTCHWCHVMERESFESDEIAAVLNRSLIPIKVDREERPDVDRIYMAFVQATSGGGGWPMSVWLTPDLKPFFGGTYFPPFSAYGRPGFRELLDKIAETWLTDRARVVESANQVHEQLSKAVAGGRGGAPLPGDDLFESAFHSFRRMFDTARGGFGKAPKFPRPVVHNFLLRYYHRSGNEDALEMVVKTLEEMAAGGMRDQLGGGFHRYSVDEYWFVPHFEKMLYDQAQLVISYLEAYQITGDRFHAGVARDTLDYVLRDMTSPGGAFYSAEDADSVIDPADPHHKGEGAFYIWPHAEIAAHLGDPATAWFCHRYGVEEDGNVHSDPQGEFTGRNILYQAHTIEQTAEHFGVPAEEIRSSLKDAERKLLEVRAGRVRPHLDDKVLTAWNGLMISAFAFASLVLDEPRYLDAARRAADFILANMFDESTGVLLRRHRDGEAAIPGFLDDHAFFVQGLIDLYEAGFDARYLKIAAQLAERELAQFEDSEHGGFFSTAAGDESLVLRMKDDYDGAEPSGNAVAMHGLLRLAEFTGRSEFREAADRALQAFSSNLTSAAPTVPQMLVALDYARSPRKQIVLAGDPAAFLAELRTRFLPNKVLIHADSAVQADLAAMQTIDGKPAAYVCENFACQLPVTDPAGFAVLL